MTQHIAALIVALVVALALGLGRGGRMISDEFKELMIHAKKSNSVSGSRIINSAGCMDHVVRVS